MRLRLIAVAVVCVSGIVLFSAAAKAELSVPPLTGRVVDQAGLLSPEQRQQISASLAEFERAQGPQLAVLTIPSLDGEPIESFSIRVVDQWKLGNEKRDDGLLLLVAAKDRRVRIEVGQGLEGQVPDALAGRIIDHVIVPQFRSGDYAGGIVAGLQAIAHALGGELKNVPAVAQRPPAGTRERPGALFFIIVIAMIIMMSIFSRRRRYYGGWGGGGGFGGWSSGGGGFSGGGFSGGGGGFSGGGASGQW